jgi:hypothetical protein
MPLANQRTNAMSHTIIGLDQAEEHILNCDVSDDALETAAGTRNEKAAAYTAPFALICIPFVAQSVVHDTAALQ